MFTALLGYSSRGRRVTRPFRQQLRFNGMSTLGSYASRLHDRHLYLNMVATLIGLLSVIVTMLSVPMNRPTLVPVGLLGLAVGLVIWIAPYLVCLLEMNSRLVPTFVGVGVSLVQSRGIGGVGAAVVFDEDLLGRLGRWYLRRVSLTTSETDTFMSLVDEWQGTLRDLVTASQSL